VFFTQVLLCDGCFPFVVFWLEAAVNNTPCSAVSNSVSGRTFSNMFHFTM
jgi:hypothetical protein